MQSTQRKCTNFQSSRPRRHTNSSFLLSMAQPSARPTSAVPTSTSRPLMYSGSGTIPVVRGYSRAGMQRPRSVYGMNNPLSQAQDDGTPLVVLDGAVLSLNRQKVESIPAFQGKRFNGQAIVTYIRAADFSVNQIQYDSSPQHLT